MVFFVLRKAAARCGFFLALIGAAALLCAGVASAQAGKWYPDGDPAPNLKLKTVDGVEYDLAALKGRVVIVNFWATWCGPCVAEMPSLQALAARLGEKNALVLGVNYHESAQKITDFQSKHPVKFPLLRDAWQEASGEWKVKVLPTTFIVDAAGVLRFRVVGEVDWGSKDVADRLQKIATPPATKKAAARLTKAETSTG